MDDSTATDAVHLRDGSIITGTITSLRPDAVVIIDAHTGVRLSLDRSTVKWISFADGRVLVPKEGMLVGGDDPPEDDLQLSLSIGGSLPLRMHGPGALSRFSTLPSTQTIAGFTIGAHLRQRIVSWASFITQLTFNSHSLDHSSLRMLRYDGGPDTEGNTGPAFSSRRTMLVWLTSGLSLDIPFSLSFVVHVSGGSGVVAGVFPELTIVDTGTKHTWESAPLSVCHTVAIGFTLNRNIVVSVRYLTTRPEYEYSVEDIGSAQQTAVISRQFRSRADILELSLGLTLP
jgi:hypothetical protein